MKEKPSFHQFSQSVLGKDIIQNGKIIPRFVVYHSLDEENLKLISEQRHPKFTMQDRPFWCNGRIDVAALDRYEQGIEKRKKFLL